MKCRPVGLQGGGREAERLQGVFDHPSFVEIGREEYLPVSDRVVAGVPCPFGGARAVGPEKERAKLGAVGAHEDQGQPLEGLKAVQRKSEDGAHEARPRRVHPLNAGVENGRHPADRPSRWAGHDGWGRPDGWDRIEAGRRGGFRWRRLGGGGGRRRRGLWGAGRRGRCRRRRRAGGAAAGAGGEDEAHRQDDEASEEGHARSDRRTQGGLAVRDDVLPDSTLAGMARFLRSRARLRYN